ncbi:hypothetical protein J6590_064324 [Homalodisca vitripennis]|nr:hypothetical protein J6590_064324 [Homalodisca vitripennis]
MTVKFHTTRWGKADRKIRRPQVCCLSALWLLESLTDDVCAELMRLRHLSDSESELFDCPRIFS